LPQRPQFALSACSFTHALPQREYDALQLIPHFTPSQVALPRELPFEGPGQAVHAPPQLAIDVLSAQTPMQSWVPGGHPQTPFVHEAPGAHDTPHAPQFFASVCSSTHAPPHGRRPPLQIT
jgi:hypothetical protein